MTFPDIPTGGRLISFVDADTDASRTFPQLLSLTKNAGDLLIACIVCYQTSTGTNAAFSGWTEGFTEVHDTATSTTMAMGIAYKFSDGTESGIPTVTQAGTITGHAAGFIMSISGAHPTEAPYAPTAMRASATAATADTGPLSPPWGADDTLWIAFAGLGETATGGSFTGISAGPGTYTNYTDTGISADVVGGLEAAIAFRQVNASSDDPGTFTVDTSNSRMGVTMFAVRPIAPTSRVRGVPTQRRDLIYR